MVSATTRVERKLAAVLAADVAGFSRLVGVDEEGVLARLKTARREVLGPLIARHRGRLFKTTGDGFLAEFASVVGALRAAVEIQQELTRREAGVAAERRLALRIGVHLGDVVVEGDDLLGDGVNVAARLEALAEPGGIAISQQAHDQARDRLAVSFEDRGEQTVKNIARPVRVYFLRFDAYVPDAVMPMPVRRVSPIMVAAGALATFLVVAMGALLLLPERLIPVQLASLRPTATSPATDAAEDVRPTMVVLPFVNMSADPNQEYFSDGITQDITTALSRFPGFAVIANNSARTYKGKAVKAQDIGRELGVRYMLEGSVQKQGDRLRLNAQLIDTKTGAHVWAEKFDRPISDVFVVQDELANRIVTSTVASVRRREGEKALTAPLAKLESYELVMRARLLRQTTSQDEVFEARRLAEQAIEKDSTNAAAYAVLAHAYSSIYNNRWNDEYAAPSTAERMLSATSRAIMLAPNDPYFRALHGVSLTLARQFDAALIEAERAISLGPNDPDALALVASTYRREGRYEDVVRLVGRLSRLDPMLTPGTVGSTMGASLYQLGRYEEAAEAGRYCVQRAPTNVLCRANLVAALAQLGRESEARIEAAELQRHSPGYSIADDVRRRLATYRDPKEAERVAEGLRKAGVPE